jgi:N-methylhydantoinase B
MRGKDRQSFTAWGAGGGRAGTTSGNIGVIPGAAPHDIGKRTVYRAQLGETIRLWGGGGGGFGDPMTRDPALVEADVANGLVSSDRARDIYGVVPGDAAATAELRAATRNSAGAFDFGTARDKWEHIHGGAAERIGGFLPSLPVAVRRYAQSEIYRRLHETGPGPYHGEAIDAAFDAVAAALGQNAESLKAAAE